MKWINDLWAWLLGEERAVIASVQSEAEAIRAECDYLKRRYGTLEMEVVADMRADIKAIKAKIATL